MKNIHIHMLFLSIKLLFILSQIKFIFPQILNNIIRLGDNGFIHNHFSFNSEGDMIIDSSSNPSNKERRFYGLRKNGRFYFKNLNNSATPYFSLFINRDDRENEFRKFFGESIFIKLGSSNNIKEDGKEYLLSVPKKGNCYSELYFFEEKNILYEINYKIFGNITSNVFSIIKLPEDHNSNFHYIFSYIVDNSLFFIKIIYFDKDSSSFYKKVSEKYFQCINRKIVSCFFTIQKKYICFYQRYDYVYTIIAFNISSTSLDTFSETEILKARESNEDKKIFFKGIHLKEEIGAFIYFKTINDKNPILILKKCNSENKMINYSSFGDIEIKKAEFNSYVTLNDLIKLNEFQICFVSTTSEKETLNIVIFNLYNNDENMTIRYYSIKKEKLNKIKFYEELKVSLYNNFISLAFSHYLSEDDNNENKYSSLIIFNYPNSTDYSLDLIQQLFITNKNIENDYFFNLEGNLKIENNIFGYVYKGTQIINYSNNIYLKNKGQILEKKEILLKDHQITLSFPSNDSYEEGNYTIEYAYVLTEPNYENIKKYYDSIDESYYNKKNEKDDYKYYDYIGKSSDFIINIKFNLTTNCKNDSCSLCSTFYTNYCITCKYGLNTINEKGKLCLLNPIEKNIEIERCSNDEILEGNCNEEMTNKQLNQIYTLLKLEINSNQSKIIQTKNIIIQISSIEEQKNNINPYISSIDLGVCEDLLKKNEGLSDKDELIILKTDIKNIEQSITYVQYEIYNPKEKNFVSLNICKNLTIIINIPVHLEENIESLYKSLNESGYNLFNINDSFYNDICSTYTSENGTDLTLADRKAIIYDNNANISMCQHGCKFQYYNSSIKKAKCDCEVQTESTITDINKIKFDKELIIDNFYKTLKNSNFLVLKCIKLVFSLKGQKNNIGSFIMTLISFIFIILTLIYIIKDHSKINYYIQLLLKQKLNQQENLKRKSSFYSFKDKINKNNINQNIERTNKKGKTNIMQDNKNKIIKKNTFINLNNKRGIKKRSTDINLNSKRTIKKRNTDIILKVDSDEIKKNSKINNNKLRMSYIKENEKYNNKKSLIIINNNINNFPPRKKRDSKNKKKSNSQKNSFDNLSMSDKRMNLKNESILNQELRASKDSKYLFGFKRTSTRKKSTKKMKRNTNEENFTKLKKKNSKNIINENQIKVLNDEELNTLNYEDAIVIDKRTFFQYYLSLLKKKHLILFAIIPTNDYNLSIIKISLLFLSFSLYFTINGFFFTDKSMNKINEDKGKYNIIFQIPKILYSTLVSSAINIILKRLSLSEKYLLSLNKNENFKKEEKEAKNIKKCIYIKLAIFFVISSLLMLFFWYFISSFCAVYKNTQMILIKDTLLSFGLSMLYPFGLNLLPGIFRIYSLRAKNKNKKCLYIISGYFALI